MPDHLGVAQAIIAMASATPAMAPAAAGDVGPVVTRKVFGKGASKGLAPPNNDRLKPSIRRTIESMVSTGSQAEYFRPDQTIILFDWDDTLCPSNWIRDNRPALSFFRPAPNEERFQKPLAELAVQVEATLKLAMKMGKVIIVTNAMEPWVETSCRNFMPSILPMVVDLPVIYARSIYDSHGLDLAGGGRGNGGRGRGGDRQAAPGMYTAGGQNRLGRCNAKLAAQGDELLPQRWKELAFEMEISGFYSRYTHQSWKNIISIGDSIFERDAVRQVVLNRPNTQRKCRTKTAKLVDEPEIGELIAQVRVIHDALGLMVQYDGNLDIEIDEEDLKYDLPLEGKILDL